jgi:chemosensory pili system protein ChpA (sensor histidine kinase/response regulator)
MPPIDEMPASLSVQLPLARLDDVMQLIGEISVERLALERRIVDIERHFEEFQIGAERRDAARNSQTEVTVMSQAIADCKRHLGNQARMTGDIQNQLMHLRMVPLAALADRLQQAARATAEECGKQVELIVDGGKTEVDARIFEQLADLLIHLFRNAVVCGIEAPSVREAVGKPPTGHIDLRATREGNQVVIRFADDGIGLEPQLNASDIGLEVAQSTIRKIKGVVTVESTPGRGTTYTLRVPLPQTLMRALVIRSGGQTFALPCDAVARILRGDAERIGRESELRHEGQTYPVYSLSTLLNLSGANPLPARLPVVIVDAGGQLVALLVEELLGVREIVVKSLGSHLRRVRGISGATLLDDNTIVPILNPLELFG